MFRYVRRFWRRYGFPISGMLLAAMYLFVVVGVPLPLPTVLKDNSAPFPCMNRPCGCQSADQCWKSCCCHTPAERLAWAHKHGIQPPLSLIAEMAATSSTELASKNCVRSNEKPCCTGSHSVCSSAGGNRSDDVANRRVLTSGTVIGIHALKCHGMSGDWVASMIALPPRVVDFEYRPERTGTILVPAVTLPSLAFQPPVPPPRTSAD
jgi:hypothetical protein